MATSKIESLAQLIKGMDVTIPEITIGTAGYVSIESYKPVADMGRFLFCLIWDYQYSNPQVAFDVTAAGLYLYGTPLQKITNLRLRYYYID